jgi:signal transduction histidine kinase
MEFSAAVSDAAGDLAWLFERTQTARKPDPFETGWKTKDGRHLVVRIHALAASTGSVEIVVEDVTGLRSLEERLRHAQRMEAVGRLAAEVARTCDALLRDVGRDVREWVSAIDDSDDVQRRRGERLLAEVTRGAALLRQLGVYGTAEERALEPVSVQRVLRDLSPVLKRVVGDGIELVASKSSGSFEVDVDAERLERMLVNVAGYARERMPGGGRIRIDLATTTVGRRFLDRYPNVRPGPHVVITVTELPRAGASADRVVPSSDKPGIEVSALVDLVAACGGHVWIEAQPAGNMVVKIHLPKPADVETGDPQRVGRLARLFRLGSGS